MEAAVAARGVSMTMPSSQSQSSRKEWRVVNDLDHNQHNTEGRDVDYFSITVDGGSDHELHLDDVIKQREQLQHLEINLKAQLIARSEVMGMQERFDSQIKEHITANVELQEQLHERDTAIMELQRTLDDKDKELHAIRLDHEAAWAKEDLLREQNKELATFRRERDSSEAERAQHLQKIHDLQEHVQEKERQFLELQEQHRAAQEALLYKDEQIREAQAWITRVQEMDTFQSTTVHTLQVELRERTEQCNQLWVGCQRQFVEMERLSHTLQQLEIELSEAKGKTGTNSDGSRTIQPNGKDVSQFVHGNGSQLEASGGSSPAGDSRVLQNGEAEIASSQTENIPAVHMNPQSLHGMQTYFPPGQLAALHPYILHHQGLPQNVNSHLVQSHVGQFQTLPVNSSIPHWHDQQALSEGLEMPNHEQHPSQNDQIASRPETNYDHEPSVNGHTLFNAQIGQGLESHPATNEEVQQSLQQISSQFHDSLRLSHSDNDNANQEKIATTEQLVSAAAVASEAVQSLKVIETTMNKVDIVTQKSSLVGKALFDEETLLACVVRTIPPGPGGRIQISSTLLSRLSKMLAPLHWSDYESRHGNLNASLMSFRGGMARANNFELLQLCHASARQLQPSSAASSHPSLMSSVAVTPMAQTRLRKAPSINSSYANAEKNRFNESQHLNGVSFNPVGTRVTNGNGTSLDRPNLGSQGKGVNHGRPSPNYQGKQQGRSTGALPGSRKYVCLSTEMHSIDDSTTYEITHVGSETATARVFASWVEFIENRHSILKLGCSPIQTSARLIDYGISHLISVLAQREGSLLVIVVGDVGIKGCC
ncbi:hypothetical protein Tco_0456524 [Tanacetum coccineum]